MAMILDGPYESMFKGKPLPPEIKEAPMLPEKTVAGRFIVMGDSEYIIYGLQNRQQRGNVNFFLNGIDYLTLGDDLIGIRSKQITDRPLSPAVRQSDSLRNFLKFMTIFLMPFALMSIGIFRYLKRRNIRRMYESVFKKESAG
jgi:ABC-type uncharacterized transport system involved in gliding motility auxiliary subunit